MRAFFGGQFFSRYYFYSGILLFGNRKNSDRTAHRRGSVQPLRVLFSCVRTVAEAHVYRILKHIVPVVYKPFSENGSGFPLFLGSDGQIEKHHKSHKFTHTNEAKRRLNGEAERRRALPYNRRADFRTFSLPRLKGCAPVRRS